MIRKLTEKFLSKVGRDMKSTNDYPSPKIDPSAWIAPDAVIIGDVEIGANTSVWPGAVIRGDIGKVTIGKNVNVQDNVVIHPNSNKGVKIGNNVTIAHGSVLDGCNVSSNVLIGINATVLHHCDVAKNTIIGACSLLQPGTSTESNSVYNGIPAQKARDLTPDDKEVIASMANAYTKLKDEYE